MMGWAIGHGTGKEKEMTPTAPIRHLVNAMSAHESRNPLHENYIRKYNK